MSAVPGAHSGGCGESPLVFLHLPKTGGTTLASIIRHHYGESLAAIPTMRRRAADEFRALVDAALAEEPRAITGHLPFGVCEALLPRARYLTVVRDPVARAVSHYHHIVANQGRGQPRSLPLPRELSLTEAVAGGYVLDNLQTRMLCGLASQWDELPADALDRAKRNLAGFDFVGTTERFDEFISLLNVSFGWPTLAYKRARIGGGWPFADELETDERDALEQLNLLDRELHAFAGELLADAVERARPEVDEELEVLTRALDRLKTGPRTRLRELPFDSRVELALIESRISRACADTRKVARREASARKRLGLHAVKPRHDPVPYPPLVFFHLPKTAGTTLESLMRYLYRDAFVSVRTQDVLEAAALRERVASVLDGRPFAAVKGHFTMGLRALLPGDARYATVLRHPVERTLSHHGHVLRGARWRPVGMPPPPSDITLTQALDLRYIPDNLQTRMLCGILSPWDELPADALDRAKRTLGGFDFVGTTEEFNEFVALLNVVLGWPTVAFKSKHVSSLRLASDQLAADELRVAENANLLDLELHAYAVELFRQARARAGEELEQEIAVVDEALDRLRRRVFVPPRSLALETRVELAVKEREIGRARAEARKHARGEARASAKLRLPARD